MLNITSYWTNENESLTKILLCIYERAKIKGLVIPSADVGVEQYRVGGSAKWYCTLENSLAVSYKIKYLLKFLLLEKFHEQRSLADYSPWGHKESDQTEQLSTHACNTFRYFPSKSKHICLHKPLYTNV